MANFGIDFGQDYNVTPGGGALTSTAQFKVAAPLTVTGNVDYTMGLHATTTTQKYAVGIIQDVPSASAKVMSVRPLGKSRAKVSDSIEAFHWVCADSAGSVRAVALGTELTFTTANVVATGVLGYALENGQTNQTIEIFLTPFVSGYNLT